MKKVLVTGAGGYIGRHVVCALLDMGYRVTAVDLFRNNIDARAEFLNADIFSGDAGIYETLGSPDVLIHLAWKDGFVHNAPSHLEFLPKHYAFLKTMAESGCKNINVMGSMHEVGYFEGAIDENTPTNPSSLYAIAKNALRQSMETLNRSLPFSFCWLRGFYICGDDAHNNSVFTKLLLKAQNGETQFPFTTGTNRYDFIDVDDLALEIALASVQDRITGTVNCCSGKPVALKDKVEQFIAERGLNITLQYGVFPDRPYDSRIIYGNNEKIKAILTQAEETCPPPVREKIGCLLDRMA